MEMSKATTTKAKTIFEVAPICVKVQSVIFMLFIPLAITSLVLSSIFSYAQASSAHWTEDDWQICFISGQKILNLLPLGDFYAPAAYCCIQSVIFACLAFGVMHRSYFHYEWLPSSIAFCFFCIFSMLSYYTFSPVFPVPYKLSASLLAFTKYSHEDMFDDLGLNNCDYAYSMLNLFLAVQYSMIFLVLLCAFVGMRAEIARQNTPKRQYYKDLTHTAAPLVLTALTFIFYYTSIFSKANFSYTLLNVYATQATKDAILTHDSIVPFATGTLDFLAVLLVVTMMAVIRGYTRQSVSAFRLGAVASVVQVATMYPIMISSWHYYKINHMEDDDKCRDFFINYPGNFNPFGQPTKEQAVSYCDSWRGCIGGEFMAFVLLHFQLIACAIAFKQNKDRPSEIFDPLDVADGAASGGSGINAKLIVDHKV